MTGLSLQVYTSKVKRYTPVIDASHRKAGEALEERLFGEMHRFGLKSPTAADQPSPASPNIH
jgi:hypothetical protein